MCCGCHFSVQKQWNIGHLSGFLETRPQRRGPINQKFARGRAGRRARRQRQSSAEFAKLLRGRTLTMKTLLFVSTLLFLSACTERSYMVQGGGFQDLCSMTGGHYNNAANGNCSM